VTELDSNSWNRLVIVINNFKEKAYKLMHVKIYKDANDARVLEISPN